MTRWIVSISLPLLACGACNQVRPNNNATNETAATVANEGPSASQNTVENVALPDDRTPLEEPNSPIDPKSPEGAGQVVQHYGALIEQGRWSESWKLWSNADAAKAFDRNWRDDSDVHMEIGKPGESEGAVTSHRGAWADTIAAR